MEKHSKEIEFLRKSIIKLLFYFLVIVFAVIGFFAITSIAGNIINHVIDNPKSLIPALLILLGAWALRSSFEEVYNMSIRDYFTKKFKKEKDISKHIKNDNDQYKATPREARNT